MLSYLIVRPFSRFIDTEQPARVRMYFQLSCEEIFLPRSTGCSKCIAIPSEFYWFVKADTGQNELSKMQMSRKCQKFFLNLPELFPRTYTYLILETFDVIFYYTFRIDEIIRDLT